MCAKGQISMTPRGVLVSHRDDRLKRRRRRKDRTHDDVIAPQPIRASGRPIEPFPATRLKTASGLSWTWAWGGGFVIAPRGEEGSGERVIARQREGHPREGKPNALWEN